MHARHDVLEINGRHYAAPQEPVVVVCIDGSESAYHERAIEAGRMPHLASLLASGTALTAESAMPAFTNPNNLSIATGTAPSQHGICGNYFYDQDRDAEVMMNDPDFLRVPTLFAEFEKAGASTAVITAKDKLRRLLGKELTNGVRFSAERADSVDVANNGISDALGLAGKAQPAVYSAELSEFVLAAGAALLESRRPDLTYLSLTDYVQHKHAPGTPPANDFYAMMDGYFARLDRAGAVLVLTADHGMNSKSDSSGNPNIVYAQSHLDESVGAGRCRVILPITDPYTAHHGALGSFATVYLPADVAPSAVAPQLSALTGIERVLTREEACREFELPADRVGDLVLVAERHTTIGTTPQRHDLSELDGPLRSHGGLTERPVPFIVNRELAELPPGHRLRNYDAYWVALNHVRSPESAHSRTS